MNRIPRTLRPLLIAFFCWLLILVVPATRQGFWSAWTNRFGVVPEGEEAVIPWDFQANLDAKQLLRRFPNNKNVELYAAVNENATKWLERYPQDAAFLSLSLQQQIEKLDSDRNEGPLTNPNYPAPPPKITAANPAPNATQKSPSRADWNKFIYLARRGQKLEPNNTFFDWMLLYALYATRQDDAARVVLAQAAQKNDYDNHQREIALNQSKVLHLKYGYPLSPRDQYSVLTTVPFSQYSRMRQTARWAMEGVIADRQKKQHDRALNAAFDLARLSRIGRRESYNLISSLVSIACEGIAFAGVTPPLKNRSWGRKARIGDPLATFQSHPRMLYFYAKSQKRSDITRFLDTEWGETGNWRKLGDAIIDQDWTGNSTAQAMTIVASERFAVLALKALPSVLVLGFLFTLISRRFREEPDNSFILWSTALRRGGVAGIVVWPLAMLCDAIIVKRDSDANLDLESNYMFGEGLLAFMPSWVLFGMAGTAVCLGLNLAVAWQKEQAGKHISLRSRFKTVFQAPEDDLVRYDFGWLLGLALHLTGWLLLLGGILLFSFQLGEIRPVFEGSEDISLFLMVAVLGLSIVLSLIKWRTLPARPHTLRLSSHLIANTLVGFFVLTSVLYALVAFTILPFTLRYEVNFENAIHHGEVAIARAKMGL